MGYYLFVKFNSFGSIMESTIYLREKMNNINNGIILSCKCSWNGNFAPDMTENDEDHVRSELNGFMHFEDEYSVLIIIGQNELVDDVYDEISSLDKDLWLCDVQKQYIEKFHSGLRDYIWYKSLEESECTDISIANKENMSEAKIIFYSFESFKEECINESDNYSF
jgi:hypothetical protein